MFIQKRNSKTKASCFYVLTAVICISAIDSLLCFICSLITSFICELIIDPMMNFEVINYRVTISTNGKLYKMSKWIGWNCQRLPNYTVYCICTTEFYYCIVHQLPEITIPSKSQSVVFELARIVVTRQCTETVEYSTYTV